MKNGNACIKCHSSDIRKIEGKRPFSDDVNSAKVGAFKKIYITRFVCISCGYSEEWIEKERDLEYLAKKAEQPDDFSNFV